MWKYGLVGLVLGLLGMPVSFAADQSQRPIIVTTIRPLAFIAQQLWGEQVELDVIVAPGVDLHHYQLKPSDLKALEEAQRVFWLGPQAEPAMAKVLAQLPPEKVINVGADLPWLVDEEHPDEIDPHAWLSLSNGVLIAENMAQSLSIPSKPLTVAVDDQLAALARTPFLLTHNAFEYFIKEYELRAPLLLTGIHGVQPSLNRLAKLNKQVAEQNIKCAIATPDYNPALVVKVFNSIGGIEVIDPLGGEWPLTTEYALFMQQIAEQFRQCLQR